MYIYSARKQKLCWLGEGRTEGNLLKEICLGYMCPLMLVPEGVRNAAAEGERLHIRTTYASGHLVPKRTAHKDIMCDVLHCYGDSIICM